jgi:hypothetical protein
MERHVDAPPWRTFGTYVLLVIGFSWSVWFAGLPRATGTERTLVVLLGAWGPTLVAVALTARRDGRPGVRSLLAGLVRWRVAARWYAVALMTVPVSALLAASVWVAVGGSVPAPTVPGGLGAWAIPLVFLVNLVVGGALAEELGWRGYLGPLVAERVGTVGAGGVVGVVWGLWHLPFYRLEADGVVAGFPLPAFLALVLAWSILMAVLVRTSGGSVLLAVLLHASANTTLGTLGVVDTGRPGLLVTYVAVQGLLVVVAYGWYRRHRRDGHEITASVGA